MTNNTPPSLRTIQDVCNSFANNLFQIVSMASVGCSAEQCQNEIQALAYDLETIVSGIVAEPEATRYFWVNYMTREMFDDREVLLPASPVTIIAKTPEEAAEIFKRRCPSSLTREVQIESIEEIDLNERN